jgi:hypothetical protein
MGYGVAVPKRSYRQMSAEGRESRSDPRPFVPDDGNGVGTRPQHREPRVGRNTTQGRPCRSCTAQIQAASRARQPRRPRKLLDPWLRAARPNRLPDVSNASILTPCGNTSRPRPSMWACRCCPAEPCAGHYWRRSVRRARHADLGRGEQTDGARSPL